MVLNYHLSAGDIIDYWNISIRKLYLLSCNLLRLLSDLLLLKSLRCLVMVEHELFGFVSLVLWSRPFADLTMGVDHYVLWLTLWVSLCVRRSLTDDVVLIHRLNLPTSRAYYLKRLWHLCYWTLFRVILLNSLWLSNAHANACCQLIASFIDLVVWSLSSKTLLLENLRVQHSTVAKTLEDCLTAVACRPLVSASWTSFVEILASHLSLVICHLSKHLRLEVYASCYVDRLVLDALVCLLLLHFLAVHQWVVASQLSASLGSSSLWWLQILALIDWALAWRLVAMKLWSWLWLSSHRDLWHCSWCQSILLRLSVALCISTSSHPVILNNLPWRTTKLLLSQLQLVFSFLNLIFQHSMVDVLQIIVLLLSLSSCLIVVKEYFFFI